MNRRWFLVPLSLAALAAGLLVVLPTFGARRSGGFVSVDARQAPYTFPAGFVWGAATAAEQIEGLPGSDWDAFQARVIAEKRFAPKSGGIVGHGDWSPEV